MGSDEREGEDKERRDGESDERNGGENERRIEIDEGVDAILERV